MEPNRMKTSLGLRMLIIGALVLILLIPALFIEGIISEREHRRSEVLYDITSKWGSQQYIAGPVLVIPVEFLEKDKDEKYFTYHRYIYLLPDTIKIDGELFPEERYRGIYQIMLYKSALTISGEFDLHCLDELQLLNGKTRYDLAYLEIGLADMKGVSEGINLDWSGKSYPAKSGLKPSTSLNRGLHFEPNLSAETKSYRFNFDLSLNGSESIQFSPAGKETSVKIKSKWQHPKFSGDFLPQEHQIDLNGFEAEWKIFHLNRNFPHMVYNATLRTEDNLFGVDLYYPVDQYQKTSRTVKYAIMFLGLTFLVYFLIEILSKKILHPVQYLLVGSALVLFYLILLALAEHVVFPLAYLLASIGMILLIVFYSKSALKENKLVFFIFAALASLYGFLYVNLQIEDYALLFGSIGLFLILALVMYFTRRIDWYTVSKTGNGQRN